MQWSTVSRARCGFSGARYASAMAGLASEASSAAAVLVRRRRVRSFGGLTLQPRCSSVRSKVGRSNDAEDVDASRAWKNLDRTLWRC